MVLGNGNFFLANNGGGFWHYKTSKQRENLDSLPIIDHGEERTTAVFIENRCYAGHNKTHGTMGMVGVWVQPNQDDQNEADDAVLIVSYEIDVVAEKIMFFKIDPTEWTDDPDHIIRKMSPTIKTFKEITDNGGVLYWVNQVFGVGPCPSYSNIYNERDHKFQCSTGGPDHFPFTNLLFRKEMSDAFKKIPAPLYFKGPFQDQPSTCLSSRRKSGRKRKKSPFGNPRGGTFDNPNLPRTVIYCEDCATRSNDDSDLCALVLDGVVWNIPIKDFDSVLCKLEDPTGLSVSTLLEIVEKISVSCEVPFLFELANYPNGVLIKLVGSDFFDDYIPDKENIKTTYLGNRIYVGMEIQSKWKYPGQMIAFFHKDSSLHPFEVPFSLAEQFQNKMGEDFQRGSIEHRGRCKFLCGRKSHRAAASPVCGPGLSKEYYYWWEKKWDALFLPQAHKMVRKLVSAAIIFGCRADPSMHAVLPGGADQSLVFKACTTAISTMNFYNVGHKDKNDQMNARTRAAIQRKIDEHCDNEEAMYLQRFGNLGGYGVSTTCGYQYISKSGLSPDIEQYFLMDGLGIGMKLCHHAGMSFMGYLFSHRSSVPIIRKIGGIKGAVILVPCIDKNGNVVFAWGGA